MVDLETKNNMEEEKFLVSDNFLKIVTSKAVIIAFLWFLSSIYATYIDDKKDVRNTEYSFTVTKEACKAAINNINSK